MHTRHALWAPTGRARRCVWAVVAACLFAVLTPPAHGLYRDTIGYPVLTDYLGAGLPTGAPITVGQVEAADVGTNYLIDDSLGDFAGKNIVDVSGVTSGISAHAGIVANNYLGVHVSIASGITELRLYEALDWIGSGFLQTSSGAAPLTTDVRVVNHSYIASSGNNLDSMRRFDYTVDEDDLIQVVGLPNAANPDFPLWKTAYNGISVGLVNGSHLSGTFSIDPTYNSGRVVPTLVTPGFVSFGNSVATSWGAPMAAASVALLIETAQDGSHSNGSYANRTRTVNHAEGSEVVKALLTAGADRHVLGPRDSDTREDLLDYTVDTDNNLDSRYGAGSLNIYHSHRILTTGEHDSTQDGDPTDGGSYGWDYDPSFGGAGGSNDTASYFIQAPSVDAQLIASLVWNLDVNDVVPGSGFAAVTAFNDLNLSLYNDDTASLVDTSNSLDENTENIFSDVQADTRYELRVTEAEVVAFEHDYAIAWRFQPKNQWERPHAGGDWSDNGFWTTGAPNGNTDDAAFHTGLTDPQTIDLDQSVTVRSLWFDSFNTYTISPVAAQAITLDTDAGDARIYLTNFHGDADQAVAATLALADNLVVEHRSSGLLSTTGGLDNSGGFDITKIGVGAWVIDGAQAHGVGASLAIDGGSVRFDSDAGAGGANLAVSVDGGSVDFKADQSLASLTVTNGSVELGGSPGLVHATGNVSLGVGSTLGIDLAGNGGVGGVDFDRINADANASLGGALDLRTGGFTPTLGDEFVILHADSLTGHFDHSAVTGAALTANTALAVLYEDAGNDANADLDLVRLFATYEGDANGDGLVDLVDLNRLGMNWNLGGAIWQKGDFNYDGVVDLLDLNALGINYNLSIPVAPAAPAAFASFIVPEPGAGVILLAGVALTLGRRRSRA